MAFVPVYILILFFTIAVDYLAGIYIEKSSGNKRKMYLIFSLLVNVCALAVFKYYNFFAGNVNAVFSFIHEAMRLPLMNILLPIGLSFHTFQAMSYTIEVYRGHQRAERHLGIYSLYVMFYPQLVAGPIERPQNLLPQFWAHHKFDYARLTSGLQLMCWGLFKKIVIADRLAIYVDAVYNNPDQQSGSTLLLATLFFSFQIYCDFSGYSDIAIGSARVMGFDLMRNFNRPYFSRSVSEFWKRWHISLSTWFKDYLYIPLGGNRAGKYRVYLNLIIVFTVSGIWHGANWTFAIWGLLNGFYLILESIKKSTKLSYFSNFANGYLASVITFGLVSFAWIFFRANNIKDALIIVRRIFSSPGALYYENPSMLIFSFFGIGFLIIVEYLQEKGLPRVVNNLWQTSLVRTISFAALIVVLFLIGVFDGGQFIYFQF